jgi:hypothetical protein
VLHVFASSENVTNDPEAAEDLIERASRTSLLPIYTSNATDFQRTSMSCPTCKRSLKCDGCRRKLKRIDRTKYYPCEECGKHWCNGCVLKMDQKLLNDCCMQFSAEGEFYCEGCARKMLDDAHKTVEDVIDGLRYESDP